MTAAKEETETVLTKIPTFGITRARVFLEAGNIEHRLWHYVVCVFSLGANATMVKAVPLRITLVAMPSFKHMCV